MVYAFPTPLPWLPLSNLIMIYFDVFLFVFYLWLIQLGVYWVYFNCRIITNQIINVFKHDFVIFFLSSHSLFLLGFHSNCTNVRLLDIVLRSQYNFVFIVVQSFFLTVLHFRWFYCYHYKFSYFFFFRSAWFAMNPIQ